jgi:2-(1,2-epoxy-1,2-dihydrophenyl)acetyl-CoA isomerase
VTPGLEVRTGDGILRIELARQQKRNALDDAMIAGLIELVSGAATDDSIRAILLTGAGEHFCSGADIVARNGANGVRPRAGSIQRRLPEQAHRLIPLLLETQTPVVCAIQGWAAGIGLAIALAADVTVVGGSARFWAPFVSRGFSPDSGLSWLLPRRIGEVRARRMLLLDEKVDAPTAVEWGLVDRVVPDASLPAEAESVVAGLAGGATVALGLTKWLLHAGRDTTLDAHLRNESFAMELSSRSEDFREGMAAFREKRPTSFTGR